MKIPAAVLWDMDGTLIDSEPYWIEAESALAARFGVDWTHADGLGLVGNPLSVSARILQGRGVRLDADSLIDALVTAVSHKVAGEMPWIHEARDLLNAVAAAGIPCALVTMSYGALVDRVLEQSGEVFSTVVTGDQVTQGKPDPEAYLLAAARLGVDARDCVAIEDSSVGIRAAHASGAATIAVPRYALDFELDGVMTLQSLAGVTVAGLTDLVTHRRSLGPS